MTDQFIPTDSLRLLVDTLADLDREHHEFKNQIIVALCDAGIWPDSIQAEALAA